MGTKYAEYVVSVTGPDKQLQNITVKSKSAEEALRQIGRAAAQAAKQMQNSLNVVAFEATTRAIESVKSAVDSLAGSYQQFDRSMRAVNTMAGKNGDDLDALTESVSELGKQIPLTRDELGCIR